MDIRNIIEIAVFIITLVILGIIYYRYSSKVDDLDVADLIVPDEEGEEIIDSINNGVTIICEGKE